jgi:hypothetical protein
MQFSFDFEKTVGKIRAMHAVCHPPIVGTDVSMFDYLTKASIPYARLHDVGGPFGSNRFVDISNIFRDFDADENDPASYDFGFTDILIKGLMEADCPPIFRLGETIENQHYINAYRILPPKDNEKWARICEHIIRHYNEGWANGFTYGIEYWEIWNEPDNGRSDAENQMWHGTKEAFYEMYEVAAKHLKSCFGDKIKVGGFATCGFRHILSDPEKFGIDRPKNEDPCFSSGRSKNFLDWIDGFFEHIKKTNAPIDCFSWHSYLGTEDTVACAKYCEKVLEKHGYSHLETQMNEWNNCVIDRDPYSDAVAEGRALYGTPEAAARAAAMMCAMQIYSKTDILCYYDARVGLGVYGGMFHQISLKPLPVYYSFAAFGELYRLGEQIACDYEKTDGVYALAAEGEGKRAVIFANSTKEDIAVETNLSPSMTAYAIDEEKNLDLALVNPKKFTLKKNTVVLFKN